MRKLKLNKFVLFFAFSFVVFVLLWVNVPMARSGPGGSASLLRVGEKAPLFKAVDLDEGMFDFEKEIGKKTYIITFWSFFCGPCREEMHILKSIKQDFDSNNLEILTVNVDEPSLIVPIKNYIKGEEIPFRVLMDKKRDDGSVAVASLYGVIGTPVLYIINKKGKITYVRQGQVVYEDLKKKVTASTKSSRKFFDSANTYHHVANGESILSLAIRYFDDPYAWRKIYNANRDQIKDPNFIYPGQVFFIPSL